VFWKLYANLIRSITFSRILRILCQADCDERLSKQLIDIVENDMIEMMTWHNFSIVNRRLRYSKY
jgi:hypothetical protein